MSALVRANIRDMAGYTPGEQPRDGIFLKLNTNESPYPASPRVLEAIAADASGERLRKYPDPLGTAFRQTAGRVLGVDPESILIGNGSDDILTIVTRCFAGEGSLITSPTPSYLLYRSLAEIQGARFEQASYTPDWRLPDPWPFPKAALTFVASPNSPSGTISSVEELRRLGEQLEGMLTVDEAYGDFADSDALPLSRKSNVIVTRSLSKSYGLAGIRFGFAVAQPALVREMIKVKDSYNCDVLSLAAATAALEDQEYLRSTRVRILATRARLTEALRKLGFDVCSSQANFVWCRRADRPVKPLYEELKRCLILIRYMDFEGYGDGLRITVGTDEQIDRLLAELGRLL
jgi:histidinol-phosphate aminotransferase